MAITQADFNKIWASTSPLTPYEFSESNYKEGWNFVGATPPSRQMWDFLQKNNDEKMQYLADNYLPLSGGTITGELILGSGTGQGHMAQSGDYFRVSATKFLYDDNPGAGLILRGRTATNDAGAFLLEAKSDSGDKILIGRPNGTLKWDGNDVITSATVETFSGNNTYNVSGYKIGRLCIVNFALPNGFASGWHTTESIITSNLPISSFFVTVGAVGGQSDANAQIRLNLTSEGKLYGYISATLNNSVQCSCVYISAS